MLGISLLFVWLIYLSAQRRTRVQGSGAKNNQQHTTISYINTEYKTTTGYEKLSLKEVLSNVKVNQKWTYFYCRLASSHFYHITSGNYTVTLLYCKLMLQKTRLTNK